MAKSNKGRKFFATTATAALVASAIVPVASAAQINDFNSISSYAQEAVQDLNDRGVIKGDQKGNFNPKSAITRAEAATILAGALELEGSGSTSFTDVKKSAWYYDAIDAAVANGIFQGQGAGKFNPSANLTRSEAAIILVDAFGLEGSADLSEFKDSGSVKSWAEEALSIAVANGVMKGDDNGNLKPNASITRQDFALMYYRTEGVEGTEEVSGSVKAINNTTVEVTFEDAVADIKALDFAIEGLTISNAVIKQTDSKTVVLTTSAQTADVEYTVTVNEEVIGTFKGVSAVIPTAVKITEQSLQAQVGTQVTLKAQVEVAAGQSKAGIPVTFNIVNNANINTATLNQPIVAEAKTDENGVATYTYTRYAQTSYQLASHDEVQAYATGNPTARSFSKVYWANIQPLAITEVTAGNAIQNGAKKVYKVKAALEHAEKITDVTGKVTGYKVNIGYQENINVTPDKAIKTVDVIDSKGQNLSYPGQFTSSTSGSNNLNNYVKEVELVLDANGEAVFTLSGSNAAITPFVFVDQKVNPTNAAGSEGRFEPTELFAAAPKVTFAKTQTLGLTLESVGVQYAASFLDTDAGDNNHKANSLEVIAVDKNKQFTAEGLRKALVNTGGRDYKATLTNKDGKTAPAGTEVKTEINFGSALKSNGGALYVVDNNTRTVHKLTDDASKEDKKLVNLKTDSKGAVSFTIIGYKDAYATPTVFVESGDKAGLDKNDLQQVGEIVYFSDAVVKTASLTVSDKSVAATEEVEYTYATVDQNGKAYRPVNINGKYLVTFEVSTTFNSITVKPGVGNGFVTGTNANGTYITNGSAITVGQGSTGSYDNHKTVTVETDAQGVASIKVSSANKLATTVNVIASASAASLPQNLTASNEFTTYATHDLHAKVLSVNTAENTVKVSDKNGKEFTYSYADGRLQINGTDAVSEASFEAALNAAIGATNQSLSVKLVDGVYIFNVLTTTPPPTVAGPTGLIRNAKATSLNTIEVTFSEAVTAGLAGQYWFDVNKDNVQQTNEIATSYSVTTGDTVVFTVGATMTQGADIGKVVYTPALATADRLKNAAGTFVSETITLDDAYTQGLAPVVLSPNALAIATTTVDTAGVDGSNQVGTIILGTTPAGVSAGSVEVQLTEAGSTFNKVTVTTLLNESLASIATKLVTALNADNTVNAKYVASNNGGDITLTAKAPSTSTLNITVTNVNAGVTSSTTVTAGTTAKANEASALVTTAASVSGTTKEAKVRVAQNSSALGNFDLVVNVVDTATTPTTATTASAIAAALNADSNFNARFVATTSNNKVVVTNKTAGKVESTVIEVN